jgi:hypothetical protein
MYSVKEYYIISNKIINSFSVQKHHHEACFIGGQPPSFAATDSQLTVWLLVPVKMRHVINVYTLY